MNSLNHAPSLFDDGQIGTGFQSRINADTHPHSATASLIDLLHDGFYVVFLIRNQYVPSNPESFRQKVLDMLSRFETQARKMQFSAEDIHDAKYAYCALLDETIVTQQNARFF
ncbi:hypothetical protein Asch01_02276 [Acinetobacter schindleri]